MVYLLRFILVLYINTLTFINIINLYNAHSFLYFCTVKETIITFKANIIMRKINDLKKLSDFLVGCFEASKCRVDVTYSGIDGNPVYQVEVPYVPCTFFSIVSSAVVISVYPAMYNRACVCVHMFMKDN